MNKNLIMIALLSAFLVGCSTTKDSASNKMVEITEDKKGLVPDWFLKKPVDTSSEFYVVATDVSKDLQFAIDKATLNAKIQIAEILSTNVQSVSRETTRDTGHGSKDVRREVDRATKAKVNQEIGFYSRQNLSIVKEGNVYRAFVLFRMNVEEGRRLTFKDDNVSREDILKSLDQ
jgi:hypothetical protein